MITRLALFPLPQAIPGWPERAYLFLRDGLTGALVVYAAASVCGIV